ncbi:MAG TPA: 16S rRNA (cytosine(1402)-N(4))-methyltransferase RsmH [Longimicrobiaceae bacterium]|nr:16S rRNA (cytosine(1402)-N(4))-methyltransferase RsmH [Longimicrobiaceae bacterium]
MPERSTPNASGYHVPVMVGEVLAALRPERGGLFLDGTLGGGGHSEAVLERAAKARVVAVDRDPDALAEAGARLARFGDRFRAVRANFADAVEAAGVGAGTLAGALLDLGISSHQIDVDGRGFTFRAGAPLDMRMSGGAGGEESAADLLNTAPEEELADVFYRYGEERRSRKLARILVEMREREPLRTSDQLLEAVGRALGPRSDAQDRARIFQALRIATNREIEALEAALPAFRDALAPGGVLAVLSYHSLEDRLVKNAFRDWSTACTCPPGLPVCACGGVALGETLTRKPVSASPDEVAANPRARSARLRAWRRA